MENVYTIETYLNIIDHGENPSAVQNLFIGYYGTRLLSEYTHYIQQRIVYKDSIFSNKSRTRVFLLKNSLFLNIFNFINSFNENENYDLLFLKIGLPAIDASFDSRYLCLFTPASYSFFIPTNNRIKDFKNMFTNIKNNIQTDRIIRVELTEMEAQECGAVNITE